LLILLVIGMLLEVQQLNYTSSSFAMMITFVVLVAQGRSMQLVGRCCAFHMKCIRRDKFHSRWGDDIGRIWFPPFQEIKVSPKKYLSWSCIYSYQWIDRWVNVWYNVNKNLSHFDNFQYLSLQEIMVYVATLALGSWPRQRGYKVASQKEPRESKQEEAQESRQEKAQESRQEEAWESHHIFPGV